MRLHSQLAVCWLTKNAMLACSQSLAEKFMCMLKGHNGETLCIMISSRMNLWTVTHSGRVGHNFCTLPHHGGMHQIVCHSNEEI